MPPILAPLIAGLLGTLAMSAFMLLPAQFGIERVDVVRAVGSYITKNRETAFVPGMILHLIAGIVFAYVYYAIFGIIKGIQFNWLTGLFAGLVHGVVVMLYVVIAVMEHHPDKRYQRRGPWTGIAQLLGHGVFGLVVGGVYSLLAKSPMFG